MQRHSGRVVEVYLDQAGGNGARLACPPRAIPGPGAYLSATEAGGLLPAAVFFGGSAKGGFLATAPVPAAWKPGATIALHGPNGRGFRLPAKLQRLALVALGSSAGRILPLSSAALEIDAAVAVFTDAALPALPTSLEAHPLSALADAAGWADFLVLDLPAQKLLNWRAILNLAENEPAPCPGQALVVTDMPCSGLADCGVCAVRARRSWKLPCRDGPVFDLSNL